MQDPSQPPPDGGMPRVFALTGGIGSGKSSVAAIWREAGLAVIDADVVARQVVEPGTPALAEIVKRFGDEVLSAGGTLDRPALAAKVFGDEAEREALNGIVHPRVKAAVQQQIKELGRAGHPLIAYEIPLLFETGQEENYRPVVVVSVDPETQLKRAMSRDGVGAEQVRARIFAQLPLSEKVARADHVIDNSGSPEQLRIQALSLLSELRKAS